MFPCYILCTWSPERDGEWGLGKKVNWGQLFTPPPPSVRNCLSGFVHRSSNCLLPTCEVKTLDCYKTTSEIFSVKITEVGTCGTGCGMQYCSTGKDTAIGILQSWALSVFFYFFNNKKWFFKIFYKVNNLYLHQSYLKSPLPVKLT